jgi:hypothetical protein
VLEAADIREFQQVAVVDVNNDVIAVDEQGAALHSAA